MATYESKGLAIASSHTSQDGTFDIESRKSPTDDTMTAKDRHTVLIPQPSDNPQDPLNWSQSKKMMVLLVISACAFLPDYTSATGAATLIPQAKAWMLPVNTVAGSIAGNVFMLGVGGVVVVALSAYFGRLPVLFWFLLIGFVTIAGVAGTKTFPAFEGLRIMNGLFITVAQAGGLMFIQDMFFLHEHAKKINLWSGAIILSPYLGPMLASFQLTTLSWHWPYWVGTIATGVCLLLVIALADETYYNRSIPTIEQPVQKSRVLRVIGVEQWKSRPQRSTFLQAIMRPVRAILQLPVLIATFYYLVDFAWAVGINNTLSIFLEADYHFTTRSIGFFYFAPVIAILLGVVLGHWIHDFTAQQYMKMRKHKSYETGYVEPEARLMINWIALPLQFVGLLLIGFCLQRDWHWGITAFAWGLFVFGIQIATVGLNAYLLELYPQAAGEVAAWVNFGRSLGGFIASYFEIPWATGMGTIKSFGIQAALCGAVSITCLVLLQGYGRKLRAVSGKLDFKTS